MSNKRKKNIRDVFHIQEFIVQSYYCPECEGIVDWYHDGPFIMKMCYNESNSFYDSKGHKRKIPNRIGDAQLFGYQKQDVTLTMRAYRKKKRDELQRQRDTAERHLSEECYGVDVGEEAEDRTKDCRKTQGFHDNWQEDSCPLPEESRAIERAERILRQNKLKG